MKSDKVEYIRFDDLKTGILMGNKPYILAHGNLNALQEVRTPMGQIELLEQLGEQLRYDSDSTTSTEKKWEAIKKCSDQIRLLCIDLDTVSKDVSHLELYLNPSELALIPFELLLNADEEPRFVSKNGKPLVLTRNFRRDWVSYTMIPEKPRVLYVHTKPDHKNFLGLPFPDIPHKNHEQSLRYALRHWGVEEQLTVLSNPTFEVFKNTVRDAENERNPFTHIHILAHGSLLFDPKRPSNFEYGIAFHSQEPLENAYKPTTAKEIKTFFESLAALPYLVNYMICDGANFTNGAKSDKNPVQVTFETGVPIVIGSQFPLSMKGSNLITKELYKRSFRGEDIREILGDIRTKLYTSEPADQHDWISLVSYVDLPDDYDFQLLMLKMEFQLVILNSIRGHSDNNTETIPSKDDFIRAKVQVEQSIADLNAAVSEIEHQKSKEVAFLENSGLLGSAYKRLAEVEFKESIVLGSDTFEQQEKYLREAKNWYRKAADRNLSHHWSLMQYIALSTVLDGGLDNTESDYWNTTRLAALTEIAKNDSKGKKSVWPYGTLLELGLLSSEEEKESLRAQILEYTEKLVRNAKETNKTAAIASTRYQLLRYRDWWSRKAFHIPEQILVKDVVFMKSVFELLEG